MSKRKVTDGRGVQRMNHLRQGYGRRGRIGPASVNTSAGRVEWSERWSRWT